MRYWHLVNGWQAMLLMQCCTPFQQSAEDQSADCLVEQWGGLQRNFAVVEKMRIWWTIRISRTTLTRAFVDGSVGYSNFLASLWLQGPGSPLLA
jgi:hypothetical protein